MSPSELVLCEFTAPTDPAIISWSPFCLKVRRALDAHGLAYSTRHTHDVGEYAHLNPARQVPILLADGDPINDSTRILAAIRGWTGTEPVDPMLRAESTLYEELADTALYGFVLASRWADPENWPRVRPTFFGPAPDAIVEPIRKSVVDSLWARDIWRAGPKACWARFGELIDALETRAPKTGFWLGETLTGADYALFGQLQSFRTPLTPGQADAVVSRRRLTAWLDRVAAASV